MTVTFPGIGPVDVISPREMQAANCELGTACPHPADVHAQLYLNPSCHVGGGVEALYDKRLNAVLLTCYQCKQPLGALLLKADA